MLRIFLEYTEEGFEEVSIKNKAISYMDKKIMV
jgi:hypothetical protein